MRPLLAVIAMSFAACATVDSEPEPEPVDPGPGSGSDDAPRPHSAARDYFDANVYPMLVARCGACHMGPPVGEPGFLASDATKAYETIKTSYVVGDFTAESPIAKLSQFHQVNYLADDLAKILEWLRLEREGL